MSADPARAALIAALDEANRRARQASGQILRSLSGGVSWRSELVATYRETYRRAMSDRAVATALLRELDAIDAIANGRAP